MASLDKYGNVVDDNTGKYIGITRNPGENDSSYLTRAQGFNDSVVAKNQTGSSTGYTPVQDNSNLISQMYEQNKAQALAELKQQIAASKSKYQTTINQAPAQYQPYRDQASANRYKNLSSLREMLANNGQQGGVNRTEETRVNAAAESDINTLNSQQQSVINEANKAIADLEASGNMQEAQIVAQNAYERLQALTNETNRVSESNYQRLRDAIGDSQYNKSLDYSKSQDAISNALAEAQLTGKLNGTNTMTYTELMARLTGTNPLTGQPTYEAQQDSVANNLAAYKATSSGSGGSGTSISDYYNGFINENADTDGETLYKNLTENKDAYIQNMGQSNYNKSLNYAQDKYYQTILDRWRGNYYGLKAELSKKDSYYKKVLGIENYNKVMNLSDY